jgi:hypothetical protein
MKWSGVVLNRHGEDGREKSDADEPLEALPVDEPPDAIQARPPRPRGPARQDTQPEDRSRRPRRPLHVPAARSSAVPCILGSILVGLLFLAGLVVTLWLLWPRTPALGLDDWGVLTDPDGDCAVRAEKEKLVITVPGTNHNLNPAISINAPRVLRSVEADFSATVKVSGDFQPGRRATIPGYPFNGAGLLLWQDEQNFLRLERNLWWVPEVGRHACYPPLVEYYQGGRYQGTNPEGILEAFFQGRSTFLRLERIGNRVTAAYSHDGKVWTTAREIAVTFPKKVFVGVAAVNSSDQPFSVEFEDFTVMAR